MKAKKSVMASLFVLAVAQVLVSCVYSTDVLNSDSPKITQKRNLKGFERIDVYGSPTVYYTQADSFSVVLEGPEDLVSKIITNVEGNTLSVRNKGKIGIVNISIGSMNDVKVYVSSPDLIGVGLYGSGDFMSERHVDTDNLQISLRGSGDIDFGEVICDNCNSELVGSGDLSIRKLEAQTSTVSLVGSGDISIKQKNVHNTDINLRGSGDVEIDFTEGCKTAVCNLVGSGDIKLTGYLSSFNRHKVGSGDIDTDRLQVR